jgi:CDP-glucose 4,6-dehydratase
MTDGADRFWSGRRVFVTGATGLLGCWTVRELRRQGAFVVGLVRGTSGQTTRLGDEFSRPDVSVRGAVEDFDSLLRPLRDHEIETVLHLAAQPIVGTALRDPRGTFEANIRGTWNVLDACRQVDTVRRIVVASSDRAYGTAEQPPYDETMRLAARHPYDVSKACGDMIAHAYHATYDLPVAIARSTNFYGGGDLNFSRIVPGTIRSVLRGERPVLRSDGTMVRDYIYIRDVVEGFLRLAEAMDRAEVRGRAYNFSVEQPQSVLELTTLILRVMGREDLRPVVLNETRAEIQEQHQTAARARRELGWVPRHSLESSLAETVEWYRAYFAAPALAGA